MIRAALAHAQALAGQTEEAQAILRELKGLKTSTYVPSYYLAIIHLALGEKDEALSYLEKAYEEHDGSLPLIKVDRRLDPIRTEPTLQDLLLRVGLAG